MHICYITHTRFPTEKAHGHQVMQVCEALVDLGHTVTLVAPTVGDAPSIDPFAYYNSTHTFEVVWLENFDALVSPFVPGPLAFFVTMYSYKKKLKEYLCNHTCDLLYARSSAIVDTLHASGIPTVLELHSIPKRKRSQLVRVGNVLQKIVALTSPMRDQLVTLGVQESQVIVAGDAVDLDAFTTLPSVQEAKKQYGLDAQKTIVGYVGRLKTLDKEKGVAYLLEAVATLKREDVLLAVFGGPEEDKCAYEAKAKDLGLTDSHVKFFGNIERADVPTALAACDILAMPFPDLPHYRVNMSPLKMFEYMASERPIITSDLPTIRDVLSEDTAFFCEPDSVQSLADSIADIVDHPEQAQQKAEAAKRLSKEHSWQKRMERILKAVNI